MRPRVTPGVLLSVGACLQTYRMTGSDMEKKEGVRKRQTAPQGRFMSPLSRLEMQRDAFLLQRVAAARQSPSWNDAEDAKAVVQATALACCTGSGVLRHRLEVLGHDAHRALVGVRGAELHDVGPRVN